MDRRFVQGNSCSADKAAIPLNSLLCDEGGVDFTITGQQLYYQYTNRDLAELIRKLEKLKKFGRPVQITEIGTTSGPTKETITAVC